MRDSPNTTNESYSETDPGADASAVIVGDVNVQRRRDPTGAFRHVKSVLTEADVLYGNLEGCLFTPGDNDIPNKDGWHHSDERMVEGLTAVGFDAVGCANNVTYGEEAIQNTMAVLDREGIRRCGVGRDLEEARRPAVVTESGTTIGFLQRTARLHDPEQGATPSSSGVASFDPERENDLEAIESDVVELKNEVDVLVFTHHLRNTATTDPEPYQRELAERVIDAGADLVVGHGAHVNQGVETYRGQPIFHCIGQLAFDWERAEPYRDGLLLKVRITDGALARVSFTPVHRNENNDVYLAPPDSQQGSRQIAELRELSEPGVFHVDGSEAVVSLTEN